MFANLKYTLQEFLLNEYYHLILFFILLSTFYFFYVTKEEEKVQLVLIDKLLHINNDTDYAKNVRNVLSTVKKEHPELLEYLKKESDKTQKQLDDANNVLKKRTYYGILILLVFLIIININIKIYYKEEYIASFTKSLLSNIVSVLILGGVEYTFFTVIVKKYNIINDKKILYSLLNKY